MKSTSEIPFHKRISFRVPLIILMLILIGIGLTIAYYVQSQNTTIIESREKSILQEAEIIYASVKNNMLAGEAPIAVDLFRDFTSSNFASEIKLYRKSGITAFSDNNTLESVNKNIGSTVFIPKTLFSPYEKTSDKNFKKSLSLIDDVFVRDIRGLHKNLTVYKPLINQPKCSQCHGLDHVIRGVIKISSSVDEIYNRASMNILISIVIYGIVVTILTLSIIMFLRRIIISRILKIGDVVEGVGAGDFKTKVRMSFSDEIGVLARRINTMIDGLRERFKLTKFVSRSTLDHIKTDDEIRLGGEKKQLTVLFTDIRGFTSYSENRDPELVMEKLNLIMNMQSEIIHGYGGDIDKFVGDEIMAIFDGEGMVIRSLRSAEAIRDTLLSLNSTEETPFYIGFGINTGEMISGNMGSMERIDRTVIGDAVNLGARLCSIAGKNTIVLSEFSYEHVRDLVDVREYKPVNVKGKDKPVKIYTLRNIL